MISADLLRRLRNDLPMPVTIAALGAVLAPAERLRSIYPRYVEAQATAGPDGLAFLPFRAGTPYQGADLVYLAHLIQPDWNLSGQVWRKALRLRREWVSRPSCARRASLPHPP